MGAHIKVEHNKAIIQGVDKLYGTSVIATDIRASCALVLAGLAAEGSTIMTGIHHWKRGYEGLENKLKRMGATVKFNHDALDVGYYTPTQNVDEFIIKGK